MFLNWNKTFGSAKLILIGGRPCMGKTTAALKLAQKISGSDKVRFIEAKEHLSRHDFENQLWDNADKAVLVVDTIQEFTRCMSEPDNTFVLEKLKELVAQKKCSVIVTSELPRSVEYRENHFPSLCDLSDKVGETNIFDFVGLVYRESYYEPAGCNDTYIVFKDADDNNTFVLGIAAGDL